MAETQEERDQADAAALEALIAHRNGRGPTSDAELVDWVYRKLALYLCPACDSRAMDQQIFGWMHVACHGHHEINFYASEFSRICRERDDLKIRLQRKTDAHDADGKKLQKMAAHIQNLEARLREKDPMTSMTPENRVKAFIGIFDKYCRDCGHEHPNGGVCQCGNDE